MQGERINRRRKKREKREKQEKEERMATGASHPVIWPATECVRRKERYIE